ncbi:MAG: glucose-6-phosphate isomerase [Dethiosulfovibrio peptidovorans]|nr:MAG: glucose-6-phosphate isomerase [Dethiosulfovibrio peptidovorans]
MFSMTFFNGKIPSVEDRLKIKEAAHWIEQGMEERKEGFGWLWLPSEDPAVLLEVAQWLRSFNALVQVGIGGSSLGNLMLHQALLPPYYNELSTEQRGAPRFYMADNLDEEENQAIWNALDLDRSGFIVVSKSGRTLETMANFLFFWERLKDRLGPKAASRVVVITDQKAGLLRQFVLETGCRSLSLPRDVGGRYSVLSSVGLLSAAALGIDVRGLLMGASKAHDALLEKKDFDENPGWSLAWNLYRQLEMKRSTTVFMPYGDRMERLAEWFCQLWAESLGKEGMGFTPQRALGAVDQHSQLQLYSQGPDDKCYVVVGLEPRKSSPLKIGDELCLQELAYMGDLSQQELLSHERRAVMAVLAGEGKPVFSITMERLDARTLGGLIFFLEYVTALTGRLMNVQPFDQPGVELGKKFANGLAGRKEDQTYAEIVREVEERTLTTKVEL